MSAGNARAAKRRLMRPPRDPGPTSPIGYAKSTKDYRGDRMGRKTAEDEGAKGDYVDMYKPKRRRA